MFRGSEDGGSLGCNLEGGGVAEEAVSETGDQGGGGRGGGGGYGTEVGCSWGKISSKYVKGRS